MLRIDKSHGIRYKKAILCTEEKGMKYIRQFGIILLISFLGELLHTLLPLPVPASIYGIVLLFTALETRILKVSAIRETASFLLEIMPMLFIPAGVGLLDKWDVLRPIWLPFAAIVVASTFIVLAAAGRVTQRVMRVRQKKEAKRDA